MNCETFARWLDDGMPAAAAGTAEAHARDCADCAAALEAARAIEGLLSTPAPAVSAPAGFGDRVMARVADVESRSVREIVLPSIFPWWTRAAAQPAAVLAFVVAGLTLRYGDALVAAGGRLAVSALQAFASAHAPGFAPGSPFTDPDVLLGIAVASLPLGAWAAWLLFRWSEGAVMARAARPDRYLV